MIRFATQEDLPGLMAITLDLHQKYPDISYHPDIVYRTLVNWIAGDKERRIALVAVDEKDTPYAALMAFAEETVFSSDKIAYEVFWHTTKKTKDVLRLFEAYEFWAEKMGCRMIHGGAKDGVMSRYLTKKKYIPLDTTMYRVI